MVAFARALAQDIRKKHTGIELHRTGTTLLDQAYAEASEDDISTLVR